MTPDPAKLPKACPACSAPAIAAGLATEGDLCAVCRVYHDHPLSSPSGKWPFTALTTEKVSDYSAQNEGENGHDQTLKSPWRGVQVAFMTTADLELLVHHGWWKAPSAELAAVALANEFAAMHLMRHALGGADPGMPAEGMAKIRAQGFEIVKHHGTIGRPAIVLQRAGQTVASVTVQPHR